MHWRSPIVAKLILGPERRRCHCEAWPEADSRKWLGRRVLLRSWVWCVAHLLLQRVGWMAIPSWDETGEGRLEVLIMLICALDVSRKAPICNICASIKLADEPRFRPCGTCCAQPRFEVIVTEKLLECKVARDRNGRAMCWVQVHVDLIMYLESSWVGAEIFTYASSQLSDAAEWISQEITCQKGHMMLHEEGRVWDLLWSSTAI